MVAVDDDPRQAKQRQAVIDVDLRAALLELLADGPSRGIMAGSDGSGKDQYALWLDHRIVAVGGSRFPHGDQDRQPFRLLQRPGPRSSLDRRITARA